MRGQEQHTNPNESALDFLWLIIIIVSAVVLIWYFGREYIASAVFFVRQYEIAALTTVFSLWQKLFSWLPIATPDTSPLQQWAQYIQNHPRKVSFDTLTQASTMVGNYLRYPAIIVLAISAVFIYVGSLNSRFKNVFSMNRLKQAEHPNWPQITPVMKLNLIKEDIDKGPWAMAMTPLDFAKKNNLIEEKRDENGKVQITLLNGAAQRTFTLQLGPVWRGIEFLPKHTQALLAIFAARANQDRDTANNLLVQLSKSSADKLDFTGVKEALAKNANTKLVQRIISRHAYVYTVMASLLELARTDGVLATSEFLWLKPIDRKLWYMLNTVGRQTAVTEISGAYAHWLVEKKLARPMLVPMVEEAVKGLEVALSEIIYEPEEN